MQRGVISREQALAAGFSPKVVRRRVKQGLWVPVHTGVYRLWIPETPEDRWLQRLRAAALWLGKKSAVSHRAATIVWELDGVHARRTELSTTNRRRTQHAGIIVHRVRSLPDADVTMRLGIPVTSVARTLLDLAGVAPARAVELAFESAVRRKLVTLKAVAEVLDRSGPTVGGRGVVRSLLDRYPGVGTESALEALVWRMLIACGLPTPVRQHEIRDETGAFVARVDFAYPHARLAIEADGYRFHSSPADLHRDALRQNALTRLGWIVYRVTWEDATARRPQLANEVAALLGSRSTPARR
jgi:very-short-patch-repair endonuclease